MPLPRFLDHAFPQLFSAYWVFIFFLEKDPIFPKKTLGLRCDRLVADLRNGGGVDTATKVIGRNSYIFCGFGCYCHGLHVLPGGKVNLQIWEGKEDDIYDASLLQFGC